MLNFQVKTKEKENKGILMFEQAVIVYAVLMAVFGAFFSVFKVDIKIYQMAVAIGDTLIVVFFILWNLRNLWKKLLGVVVCMSIFTAIFYERIYVGFIVYRNTFIELYNVFYVKSIPISAVEMDLFSVIAVLVSISLVFSLILVLILKKKKGLICAIVLILSPVILSAIVGKMPETFWSLAVLVTGCFYVLFYIQDSAGWHVRELAVISGVLVAVIGVSLVIEPLITNYKMDHIEQYSEIKQKIVQQQWDTKSEIGNIGMGSLGGGISEGNLSGLTSFNPTGKRMLEVVIDVKPTETVYLKAFVGSEYTGERWEEISNLELSEVVSIIGGADEKREILNEPYRRIDEGDNTQRSRRMYLTLIGADKKYGYAPYAANVTSEHKVRLDSCIEGNWSKERYYDYYLEALHITLAEPSELWLEYKEFVEEAYVNDYPELSRVKEYTDVVQEYLEAQEHYDWWLESSFYNNILSSYAISWSGNDKYNETDALIDFIFQSYSIYDGMYGVSSQYGMSDGWDNRFTYSRNPGAMPEDMDFVEGFLLEKKTGFCMHYATAATVLFQMYGEAARYVEGYAIEPQYFKLMGDGKYKAVVTDAHAHAWCEVFDPYELNTGWMVFDYTTQIPNEGYSADDSDDWQSDSQENPDNTQGEDVPEDNLSESNPPEDENQDDNETTPEDEINLNPTDDNSQDDNQQGGFGFNGNNSSNSKMEKTLKKLAATVGISVAIVVFILSVISIQRKVRRKRKLRSFREMKNNRGILKLYNEMYEICLYAGLKVSEKSEREEVKKMMEMFPQISEKEWNWIYNLAERAAFSGEIFSLEEQKEMRRLYQILRKNVLNSFKFVKKIWFLYGRAM